MTLVPKQKDAASTYYNGYKAEDNFELCAIFAKKQTQHAQLPPFGHKEKRARMHNTTHAAKKGVLFIRRKKKEGINRPCPFDLVVRVAVPHPLRINLFERECDARDPNAMYSNTNACLGMLVQLPVDVQHKNGVQVKDGRLQQRVQLDTRGRKVIVHAQNMR
jgi:hypothetical protein